MRAGRARALVKDISSVSRSVDGRNAGTPALNFGSNSMIAHLRVTNVASVGHLDAIIVRALAATACLNRFCFGSAARYDENSTQVLSFLDSLGHGDIFGGADGGGFDGLSMAFP